VNDTGEGTSALFSASKFYALDVQELVLDPEIEEAAIRFASGDDHAAEHGLLEILKKADGGGAVDEWLTLFDLYRAIGNADSFESLAIDFANRFSTSAPQWFSMKAELAARTGAMAKQATSSLGKATWVADTILEPYAATVLAKLLERTPQPWVLDWAHLQKIEPGSLPALIQLFKTWAATSVDLRFVSAATLRECLERMTVPGDSTVNRAWWELRLLVLRVMNMGSDFEPVAIDYCVTYELSPPSWEPPVCRFRSLHVGEPVAAVATTEKQPMFVESQLHDSFLPSDSESSGFSVSQLSLDWPTAYLEGEICDDAQAALSAIDQQLGSPPVLVVSCKYLIRVDFSSAGNILNWAAAHQREGRQVRFTDVHRLIAAFFHVVGVTESAKIITRSD
jgi:anti-anti-sigma regulatory factor